MTRMTVEEIGDGIKPVDKLRFRDSRRYRERLASANRETGENDALVAIRGNVRNISLVAAAFEFEFMGGSMGSVVGERFVRAVDVCINRRVPLVCFSASGGARMQEALISLFQMAKTSSALGKLRSAGLPYISILTNPTMGGVSASLGTLGDINIAEPGRPDRFCRSPASLNRLYVRPCRRNFRKVSSCWNTAIST